MKTVLITGASTGIGQASVEYLAGKGWTVFAGVRKESDAETLNQLDGDVRPLFLDVTNDGEIDNAITTISAALGGETLAGLVNNAGIANMGPLALQPMEDIRSHFEVNVFGLMALHCVPRTFFCVGSCPVSGRPFKKCRAQNSDIDHMPCKLHAALVSLYLKLGNGHIPNILPCQASRSWT